MELNGSHSQHVNHSGHATGGRRSKFAFLSLRTASVGLLVSIAILVLAVAAFVAVGGGKTTPSRYVDGSKIQAVFINGSNTPYFGKITHINSSIIRLTDIYYLRVNQQIQPDGTATADKDQPLVLVKLGCEVHGPEDSMVINQEQVIFWENLNPDGKVSKGIEEVQTKYDGDCKKIEEATQAAANANKQE